MTVEDDILALMQLKGPVLPADVAKQIKTNILLASAYLSELASRKKLKISSLKVGGSPVYFLVGQEEKLERFASNLNDKDLRAYEMLKQKVVLRDSHMTPLVRVALRSIKDFAMPINVTFGNTQELFWKWHSSTESDVKQLIQRELEDGEEVEAPVAEVPKKKKKVKDIEKIEKTNLGVEKVEKIKPESTQKIERREIPQKIEPQRKNDLKKEDAPFSNQTSLFFKEKGIRIIHEEMKKDGEATYVIEIPSAMGMLKYLCKARNKKSSSERDLSSALVDGQLHKMPVVYLHTGKLNAQAEKL